MFAIEEKYNQNEKYKRNKSTMDTNQSFVLSGFPCMIIKGIFIKTEYESRISKLGIDKQK